MIGEYNIPKHVIFTFSLRASVEESLLLDSRFRFELGLESPGTGLGDLKKESRTIAKLKNFGKFQKLATLRPYINRDQNVIFFLTKPYSEPRKRGIKCFMGAQTETNLLRTQSFPVCRGL